uniref:Uncharacterized protein n=1 Tax=Kalanchoe fedtschenkoi TaxID=63787 RepID=A0A7N0VAG3_KALFE
MEEPINWKLGPVAIGHRPKCRVTDKSRTTLTNRVLKLSMTNLSVLSTHSP